MSTRNSLTNWRWYRDIYPVDYGKGNKAKKSVEGRRVEAAQRVGEQPFFRKTNSAKKKW